MCRVGFSMIGVWNWDSGAENGREGKNMQVRLFVEGRNPHRGGFGGLGGGIGVQRKSMCLDTYEMSSMKAVICRICHRAMTH